MREKLKVLYANSNTCESAKIIIWHFIHIYDNSQVQNCINFVLTGRLDR